jgi:hypothetical protein
VRHVRRGGRKGQLYARELAENIAVEASHAGMAVNPTVRLAIADRLAQPEGDWKPFRRSGLRRLLYPDRHRRACIDAAFASAR